MKETLKEMGISISVFVIGVLASLGTFIAYWKNKK